MAIMKLSEVPEIDELNGTENIYVNDNGETKQISYGKVVDNNRIVLDFDNDDYDNIFDIVMNYSDIWVKQSNRLFKVLGYDCSASCGSMRYLKFIYADGSSIKTNTVDLISFDEYEKLLNIGTH